MPDIDPHRRRVLAFLATSALYAALSPARAAAAPTGPHRSALAALEAANGGRLGVFVVDGTQPGRSLAHRADEAFGLCSTFKLLLAAAVLREADAGRLSLDEELRFDESDLVPHAPVLAPLLAQGRIRIEAAAEATQTTSDNVAANLLLRRLGGTGAFTALLRAMGDERTRIDRFEPEMNFVPAGELRDTTTPRAMASTVARLFTGGLLSAPAQAKLKQWMIATRTGLARLRAGLPADWSVGDKTGTANSERGLMPNKHNDVAVVWGLRPAPIVIAAYYEADGAYVPTRERDDAVLAEVGRIVAGWIG